MTHPTSVGRERHVERRALLVLTTAICSILTQAASADDYVPPKIDTRSPTGVNLADGSFVLSTTDLSIGPLTLERVHQGGRKDPSKPFFGSRMSHNFDIYVAKNTVPAVYPFLPSRYKPVVHTGSAASGVYVQDKSANPSVFPSSMDAAKGSLTLVAGAYVYTAQDGTIYTFSPSVPVTNPVGGAGAQRVTKIEYPNGRTLVFSYNGSYQLKTVTDNGGYALVFDYNGSGYVSAACGYNLATTYVTVSTTCTGASIKATYGYSGDVLTSFTDVRGSVTTYAWLGSRLTCVQPPSYTSCKIANVYSSSVTGYQVSQQTLSDGAVWNFSRGGYDDLGRNSEDFAEAEPSAWTTVTDPTGKVSYYSFVKSSPYGFVDASGRTTSYRYKGGYDFESSLYDPARPELAEGTMLTEVVFPEQNTYLVEYGGPRYTVSKETWTPKPGSSLPAVVIETGYNCTASTSPLLCTKPAWKRNPNGKQTDYTYTTYGSIASEMQPAPSPVAARPLKLYTYVQKYAYVKNASSALVPASTPMWLPWTETQCQTAVGSNTPVCDTSAPQMVTTYEYGANSTANNLLVRGRVVSADGQSLRTCYQYDAQANKIAETTPRAGLTSCS